MIYPKEAEFEAIKSQGYLTSVVLTINADEFTPISLFYNLQGQHKFLLESAENGNTWGRYSFLGANPYLIMSSYGKKIKIEKDNSIIHIEGNILEEIEQLFQKYKSKQQSTLPPFFGGAVGYVGYDVIRQYEKLPDENTDTINAPEACLMLYQNVIAYDHYRHQVLLIYNTMPEENIGYTEILEQLAELKDCILRPQQIHPIGTAGPLKEVQTNYSREAYMEMVEKIKKYIVEGDIFQAVLSLRLTAATEMDPFDAYRKLRSINPSPYLFYLDFGTHQVIGSSPESLVSLKDSIVLTNPIAGTRPRGKSAEEDELLKQELLADEKERAEHMMLLDLGRNDLGKISQFGTVEVKRYMEVDLYSHVMHLVSTVAGKIREDKSCFSALAACLPAGTVSGAPKVRAMEIIDELENVRRGIYAGAVGYFSYSGNSDMCIAIRTIVFKDGKAYIQSGAGIVYDSIPDKEYEEVLAKAMVLKEALL
ncbi:anthranilate synthase component I [Bacillota bacterium LX-D]|nr:anthranilate synthase component I [Bacillota bacterium LX-D]